MNEPRAILLPLTPDAWQVFTLDWHIGGDPFQAQVELRYLPAPDLWTLSLWDHAAGQLLVNQIPLICSCGVLNDLFFPFRGLREGKGIGALYCLRAVEEPSMPDPAAGNLTEFQLIWEDTPRA